MIFIQSFFLSYTNKSKHSLGHQLYSLNGRVVCLINVILQHSLCGKYSLKKRVVLVVSCHSTRDEFNQIPCNLFRTVYR